MTKYHLLRAFKAFCGIFHSKRFRAAGIASILMVCFVTNASAENWKLRIKNITSAKIKVKWYCDNGAYYGEEEHQDTDTFPGSDQKTRELSLSKCLSGKFPAVTIQVDNKAVTMNHCTYEFLGCVEAPAHIMYLWDETHDDYDFAGHKNSGNVKYACIKVTWSFLEFIAFKMPGC